MRVVRKLVRDRIPEALAREGRLLRVEVVEGGELCRALMDKVVEEVRELRRSPSVEEVADILEVLKAIAKHCLGIEWGVVEEFAERKRVERGSFDGGFIAEYVLES